MTTKIREEIASLLDTWLEYGQLKKLADLHLKGKHRYVYASKIKHGVVNHPRFLDVLITQAIQNKAHYQHQLEKLRS